MPPLAMFSDHREQRDTTASLLRGEARPSRAFFFFFFFLTFIQFHRISFVSFCSFSFVFKSIRKNAGTCVPNVSSAWHLQNERETWHKRERTPQACCQFGCPMPSSDRGLPYTFFSIYIYNCSCTTSSRLFFYQTHNINISTLQS